MPFQVNQSRMYKMLKLAVEVIGERFSKGNFPSMHYVTKNPVYFPRLLEQYLFGKNTNYTQTMWSMIGTVLFNRRGSRSKNEIILNKKYFYSERFFEEKTDKTIPIEQAVVKIFHFCPVVFKGKNGTLMCFEKYFYNTIKEIIEKNNIGDVKDYLTTHPMITENANKIFEDVIDFVQNKKVVFKDISNAVRYKPDLYIPSHYKTRWTIKNQHITIIEGNNKQMCEKLDIRMLRRMIQTMADGYTDTYINARMIAPTIIYSNVPPFLFSPTLINSGAMGLSYAVNEEYISLEEFEQHNKLFIYEPYQQWNDIQKNMFDLSIDYLNIDSSKVNNNEYFSLFHEIVYDEECGYKKICQMFDERNKNNYEDMTCQIYNTLVKAKEKFSNMYNLELDETSQKFKTIMDEVPMYRKSIIVEELYKIYYDANHKFANDFNHEEPLFYAFLGILDLI